MSIVDGAAAQGTATGEQAAAVLEGQGPLRARGRIRLGPQHAALAAILVLSGLLEFVRLSQNGFANIFYSAAVKSMLRSWHNFFFISADPNGLITVDKPPLALWLQGLSAKLFGFTPLSLLIPEGVCALLAVALLYRIVAPRHDATRHTIRRQRDQIIDRLQRARRNRQIRFAGSQRACRFDATGKQF